jgi:hypothetical protein
MKYARILVRYSTLSFGGSSRCLELHGRQETAKIAYRLKYLALEVNPGSKNAQVGVCPLAMGF